MKKLGKIISRFRATFFPDSFQQLSETRLILQMKHGLLMGTDFCYTSKKEWSQILLTDTGVLRKEYVFLLLRVYYVLIENTYMSIIRFILDGNPPLSIPLRTRQEYHVM